MTNLKSDLPGKQVGQHNSVVEHLGVDRTYKALALWTQLDGYERRSQEIHI